MAHIPFILNIAQFMSIHVI